jgi:ABC-type glycerol-3-phosphate transport system substrate-binding protein
MTMAISRREFLTGAGVLAAAGAGTLLTGCGSSKSTSTGSKAAPVTLTIWANHPEWKGQIATMIKEFEAQNPSITIQLTEKPGPSYPTLVTTALTAGSAPDIFGAASVTQYKELAKSGKIYDLTGKINVGQLLPSATSLMYIGKKYYGLPLFGEYTTGIYYWKPKFAKYNLKPPTTWPELTTLCATLKSHGETPMEMPSSDGTIPTFVWTGLMTTVRGPSGVTDVAEGKAKLTDPEFLAAATYLKSLAPYFAPGYASTAYINGKAAFAEGKSVMLEGGSADYAGFVNVNPKVDLGFFALPHPQGSGMPCVNSGPDTVYSLNTKGLTKDKADAAVKFFNFFLTPKIGTEVADTIELPDIKGARSKTPIQEEIIQQSTNDAPEWYILEPLVNFWQYSLDNIAKMLLGTTSPEKFAAGAQATIS